MRNKPILRAEMPSDFPAIRKMHEENFGHSLEADLINSLRGLSSYQSYYSEVLEDNGQIVGHVMLTPVQIVNCDYEIPAMILAPVSIAKPFQGQGYGTYMVSAVLEVIKRHGFDIALVYGGDYYHRFGFEKAKYVYRPNPVPGHGILMKALNPVNQEIRGVIRYPRPFDPLIHEWDSESAN